MSSKTHTDVQAIDPELKLVGGSCVAAGGTAQPTSVKGDSFFGAGLSFTKTANAGEFIGQVGGGNPDTYPVSLVPPNFSVSAAAPAAAAIDVVCTSNTIDVDGKFTFLYRQNGTAVNPAAGVTLGVMLFLLNRRGNGIG